MTKIVWLININFSRSVSTLVIFLLDTFYILKLGKIKQFKRLPHTILVWLQWNKFCILGNLYLEFASGLHCLQYLYFFFVILKRVKFCVCLSREWRAWSDGSTATLFPFLSVAFSPMRSAWSIQITDKVRRTRQCYSYQWRI